MPDATRVLGAALSTRGQIDPTSLERIVPDEIRPDEATGSDTLRLHLERYEFACRNLVPGSVLDIACGVGYGTALLSQNPQVTSALGVDLSAEAVEYARNRYASECVSFACSDALEFRPGQTFDNIVSLETIEHVDSATRSACTSRFAARTRRSANCLGASNTLR